MRLLDLFCGAGGAAMGYHRAGFEVYGIDIQPQPHYPFEFLRADALHVLEMYSNGRNAWPVEFDAIHASPPCQAYSTLRALHSDRDYANLYETVRGFLENIGTPWVIENVIGSPYRSGFILCGSLFGLPIRRHRNFETSELILVPPCRHEEQVEVLGIYGHSSGVNGTNKGPRQATTEEAQIAMGMPWATRREITQAVPPAYTEFIGRQLIEQLERAA